eukprot:scaffold6480_cov82-Isochrysis_galbana.AAC.4
MKGRAPGGKNKEPQPRPPTPPTSLERRPVCGRYDAVVVVPLEAVRGEVVHLDVLDVGGALHGRDGVARPHVGQQRRTILDALQVGLKVGDVDGVEAGARGVE